MCTSPIASSLGVDGERDRSSVAGSPMRTSALAWEVWNSWNSFHSLSHFLSPDDGFLSQGDWPQFAFLSSLPPATNLQALAGGRPPCLPSTRRFWENPLTLVVAVAVMLVPNQPLQQSYRVAMGHAPGPARLLPTDHGVSEEFLASYLEESSCRRGEPGSPTTPATRVYAVGEEDAR